MLRLMYCPFYAESIPYGIMAESSEPEQKHSIKLGYALTHLKLNFSSLPVNTQELKKGRMLDLFFNVVAKQRTQTMLRLTEHFHAAQEHCFQKEQLICNNIFNAVTKYRKTSKSCLLKLFMKNFSLFAKRTSSLRLLLQLVH